MDEDFVRKIFVACDKDKDGFLDRSDLEEVRKQFGLEGDISEILEQFGATQSGKISFNQFCDKSAVLFTDLNQSSSESSPEYFTDSDTQLSNNGGAGVPMEKDRTATKKEDAQKNAPKQRDKYIQQQLELDLELDISNEKIKRISDSWGARNPHRRSGGGIEDYLDEKTLQHLEELNILDPPPEKSFKTNQEKDIADTNCFQISEISKQVHLAALTSYENKIHTLVTKLRQTKQERDSLRHQQTQWQLEKQKLQLDFDDKFQSQQMRITELQSVIAELTRKLNKVNGNKIIEEEEDIDEEHEGEEHDDDDARSHSTSDLEVQGSHADCSDCSCENCNNLLDNEGPNQVNFLATATHENDDSASPRMPKLMEEEESTTALDINGDLQNQLHHVLGALESRLEARKQSKQDGELEVCPPYEEPQNYEDNNQASQKNMMEEMIAKETRYRTQMNSLVKLVDSLRKEKRTLEKQLHNMNVQGYVYQKGNTAHVEDEFNKLRQENSYLRSKLKKAEHELEDTRGSLIIAREEKDRLKKKARNFQETMSGKVSPVPSAGSAGSTGHRRSNSAHIVDNRSTSPSSTPALQRSSSAMVERSNDKQQRSLSLGNRSHSSPGNRSPGSRPKGIGGEQPQRKYSPANAGSNTLPHTQSSPFISFNSKGYMRSPESSLSRGQHAVDTSDLGSSIGDEGSRNELNKSLLHYVRHRVPEALLQSLLSFNSIEHVLKLLVQHFLAEVEEKIREGAINVERVESRMAHLQSQNDLIQLSLEESKQNSERLSLLCGKYESNSTAWSLALQDTEHLIETYEVLLQLQESEADIFAANCQAAGIAGNFDTMKSLTSTKSSISNISIASSVASSCAHQIDDEEVYKNSHNKRRDAESHAKLLLHKLDKKFENPINVDNVHDIDLKSDELSYQSRTSTGSSQASANTDTLSKDEEHRLRDYVRLLKRERGVCKGTVIELESIHQYSDINDVGEHIEPSTTATFVERSNELNIDLETAVILQEMQALKEERAELKHRIYLLEKEKRSLELKMNSREAQEQAYIVHIEHLKSEVKEQIKKRRTLTKDSSRRMQPSVPEDERSVASYSTHSTNPDQNSSNEEIPSDLVEATRRERKLKQKIQDLLDTLEKLSKNSDIRQRQTAEYISDLKRANGALVTAYEKAKKRHASRLKKFEIQLVQMAEKYQLQMRNLKEQIVVLKATPSNTPQTETSL